MKFIHVTDLNGRTVAIAAQAITTLRSLDDAVHGYGPEAKTLIHLGGDFQAVRETMTDVEAKLKDI